MNCGALILAAGASTRFGRPKQLARLGGESLLERSVRIAREAGCVPVIVVLGAFEELIRNECELQDAVVVSNPDWAKGMGTSLSRGVCAFEAVSGVLVMTCDMPAVTADHLRMLAAGGGGRASSSAAASSAASSITTSSSTASSSLTSSVTASSYAGRKGVPAYFPRDLFPELLKIRGDAGARDFLQFAKGVNLPGGELDIDTIDDLEQAQSILASGLS